ncbi:uncharacterized protein C18orf63-like, partial [Frankliniella occidentalis]|uniref:Uncharacterized protein C18orf63-like n=1 Tax=Frankliniella occidentalis TaxID=133901 RepID=A0A9C6XC54_FRAOC
MGSSGRPRCGVGVTGYLWAQVTRGSVTARSLLASTGDLGVAWLTLTCCRLRLAPLNLPDLDVGVPVLETFHQDPLGYISEMCIGQPWVHVLPSLKRGLIVGISKTLPEETPFRRYKDLRRHWKNMYGYRLSEEPADMYCSVYFRALGGVPMTYPWPCLTPRMPSGLRCLDVQAVVLSFLADVALRMPTVCGEPSPVAVDGMARLTATLCTAAAPEAQYDAAGGDPNSGAPPPPRPNLRPLALGENTSPSPPRNQDTDDESVASTCPLSLATQRD